MGEAGISGDDGERLKTAECGDDVFDHAIGKVVLFGITAQVCERQNREGWQNNCLGLCVFMYIVAHQPIPHTRHRDDPVIAIEHWAKHLAQRCNLHSKVAVFNNLPGHAAAIRLSLLTGCTVIFQQYPQQRNRPLADCEWHACLGQVAQLRIKIDVTE